MGITRYSFILPCLILIILNYTDKSNASAVPTCKAKCRGQSGSLLKFEEGVTYTYNLEGHTETSVPESKGPFGETVKLSVKAKVNVLAYPQCQTAIHLRDVHISGPDGTTHPVKKFEAHPLVVSLHGGKMDSEVCAVHDDDYFSLNMKRAIASLFQANTGENGGNGQETDVFGSCPTHFKVTKDGDTTVITKQKDLERCQFRENLRQSLFSRVHAHPMSFQSTPLLDSDYEVEQRVKGGILESATAKEEYLFRPFSSQSNGAKTKVFTKLVLESKAGGAPPEGIANNVPRTIFFENPHETVACSFQTLNAAVSNVLNNAAHGAGETSAKDFSTLVRLMRQASKDDLLSVYGNCKAGTTFPDRELAKKVFTDALFQAGSAESVSAAIELLRNDEIIGDMAKLWYLSFGFVRHTSASALGSALTLLDNPHLPYEAYLGIGALAGHYCREHVCDGIPQFDELLAKFTGLIGSPTKIPKDKENYVVAALKGLKNIKHLNDETANKITQIMKDAHVSARIRVAALETAQSDACRGKIQKGASDIFYNREEDSELRIKAYLVLVECATPKLANKLSEFLETEQVNQVGSFVTSHLHNLRASSNPDKQHIREVLYNVKPRRKFPFDIRKFSRNYEFSYNLDGLSTSAAAESNVIFSQKSFLPRSVNLNLTVEVFGHAFNLFELSGRAENLEKIYERYASERGYLRTHTPEQMYIDTRNFIKKTENHILSRYNNLVGRGKRSVTSTNAYKFGQKVKLHNSKLDYNIDVDLSMKILGNELSWMNFDNIDRGDHSTKVIDKIGDFIDNAFGKAKNYRNDVKNHMHFLDTELAYPTSTGLPLRLNAIGSAVVHIKMGGNFDLSAFMKNPKNGYAKFEFIPSASVEIVGELGVDGYAVDAGVKVNGNLHTSTGTEVTMKILDGKGFDLKIGIPMKQNNIITLSSDVYSFVRPLGLPSIDKKLEFNTARKDYSACFDQLKSLTGLIFCGEVGYPSEKNAVLSSGAMFPLNGHSKLSLMIDKEDESLKVYHMLLYFDVENPENRRFEFKIETPNTSSRREISILGAIQTKPEKAIDFTVRSPIHNLISKVGIKDTPEEYSLYGFIKMDDQEYKAKLGALRKGDAYTPILEYTPGVIAVDNLNVKGEVTVRSSGDHGREFFFKGVQVQTGDKMISVDGTLQTDQHLFRTDLSVVINDETIGLKTHFENQGWKKFKAEAEFSPMKWPQANWGFRYQYQREEHSFQNDLELYQGPNLATTNNRLIISQQLTHHIDWESKQFDISTKNAFSYKLFEIGGKLEGGLTRKSLHYDIEAMLGKHQLSSKLNAKTFIKDFGDYEYNFEIGGFGKELHLEGKRDIIEPHKSSFVQKIEIKPGFSYEVTATVNHYWSNNELKLTIIANSPNYPNHSFDAGMINTPALFDGHVKIHDSSKYPVEAFLKFTKVSPIHGSFKFYIENYIDSHGELACQDSKATGSFTAHMVRINDVLQGSMDLSKNGHKYIGIIQSTLTHEGNPKWSLHIQTDTDLTRNTINSRNRVTMAEKQFEVNFDGERMETDGTKTGNVEVTLPDGKYFTVKIKEKHQITKIPMNGELFLEFGVSDQKGAPMRKFTLDTYAKGVNIPRYSIDSKFEIDYEQPDGKKLSHLEKFSSVPHDDKIVLRYEGKQIGSSPNIQTFEILVNGLVSPQEMSFDGTLSALDFNLNSKGKLLTGTVDRIRHLEFFLEENSKNGEKLVVENLYRFVQGNAERPHEFQIKNEVNLRGKMIKLNGEGQISKQNGGIRGTWMLPGYAKPSDFDFTYKNHDESGMQKIEASLRANYEDKNLALNGGLNIKADFDLITGQLSGQTPLKSCQTLDLQFTHKKISSTARNTDFTAVINGKKTDGYAKIDLNQKQFLMDVLANCENGKNRAFFKFNKKSNHQFTSEGQVAWTIGTGGQADFSSNVDIESYENFHVLGKFNSEKLKFNKLKLEVGNKGSKGGKKINFVFQNAEKTGISGSVSYAVKEDEDGFTIEGKGNVDYQGGKSPLTYRVEYKTLNKEKNQEVGMDFTINAEFDKGKLQARHKISDFDFITSFELCKDERCAEFEAVRKIETIEAKFKYKAHISWKNTFEGKNTAFKTYSFIEKTGFLIDHESGIILNDITYQMKSHIHQSGSGILIILPHREIEAAANYEIPIKLESMELESNINPFVVRFDGSLFLDKKNKPDVKGTLSVFGEFSTVSKSVSSQGEIKVTHTHLPRELVLRGKYIVGFDQRVVDASFDVDIFNKKNQRISGAVTLDFFPTHTGRNITGKAELVSKGLNLDIGTEGHVFVNEEGASAGSFVYYHDKNVKKEAGAMIRATNKNFYVIFKAPNKELLKIDAVIQGSPEQQMIDGELHIAEMTCYMAKFETNGFHTLKGSVFNRDTSDRKFEIFSTISPKILEFKADNCVGADRNNLISVVLTAKSNTEVQPNFEINAENIKLAMKNGKEEMKTLIEKLKNVITDVSKNSIDEYNNMVKGVKKMQTDIKPLMQHFKAEFEQIKNEIAEDPNLKNFSETIKQILGTMIETIDEFVHKMMDIFEKMSQELIDYQKKLVEIIKGTFHKFIDSSEKLAQTSLSLFYQLCDIGCKLAEYGIDFIKAHEMEIREVLVGVSGYVHEFAQFWANILQELRHDFKNFMNNVIEQVKTIPIYTFFEEKFKGISNIELPTLVNNFLNEINFAINDFVKNSEISEGVRNLMGYFIKFPVPSFMINVPTKMGGFKGFPIIRYLKWISELPTATEFFITYRPLLTLRASIPPAEAYGIILGSHHFFTFDQKHYAFKGTCAYILAQDFLDGNFSIVANIENGKLNSIALMDRKDTVEILHDNTVIINGRHTDFPVHQNDLSGWARYGTYNLVHKSGVHIIKYLNQDMIIFRINGFYFGRTRGLLGTISNEHYDEYTMPNGHIAKDETEFVNAYKLTDECQAGTAQPYPPVQAHVPECTRFFSSESSLRAGFPLINHEIYREACDIHAGNAQGDKLKAACDVAGAYVLALNQGYMPYASIPEECVKCSVNGQSTGAGDKVEVQSPQGKADVVIVFQQSASNSAVFKELITPLIATLSHDLKEKGLGDVNFALIGYGGPHREYPEHFGNNGKITYEGKADQIKFWEKDNVEPPVSQDKYVDLIKSIWKYIKTELGRDNIVMAMNEANIYPFRQGASKIILLVNSEPCPLSPTFPFSLQLPRSLSIRHLYHDLGLQFHIITPMAKTTITNKPDQDFKNVVGFDAQKLYTFGDAKKAELEGDATNRVYLDYPNDLCVSFSQYNGGSAFNLNVFSNAKPEQQKKFVHVVSKRIVKGAMETQFTETCTCKLYHGLFPYPNCKVTSRA